MDEQLTSHESEYNYSDYIQKAFIDANAKYLESLHSFTGEDIPYDIEEEKKQSAKALGETYAMLYQDDPAKAKLADAFGKLDYITTTETVSQYQDTAFNPHTEEKYLTGLEQISTQNGQTFYKAKYEHRIEEGNPFVDEYNYYTMDPEGNMVPMNHDEVPEFVPGEYTSTSISQNDISKEMEEQKLHPESYYRYSQAIADVYEQAKETLPEGLNESSEEYEMMQIVGQEYASHFDDPNKKELAQLYASFDVPLTMDALRRGEELVGIDDTEEYDAIGGKLDRHEENILEMSKIKTNDGQVLYRARFESKEDSRDDGYHDHYEYYTLDENNVLTGVGPDFELSEDQFSVISSINQDEIREGIENAQAKGKETFQEKKREDPTVTMENDAKTVSAPETKKTERTVLDRVSDGLGNAIDKMDRIESKFDSAVQRIGEGAGNLLNSALMRLGINPYQIKAFLGRMSQIPANQLMKVDRAYSEHGIGPDIHQLDTSISKKNPSQDMQKSEESR